jgi:hypothetical protein
MTDTMTYPAQAASADLNAGDDQNPDQRRKLLLLGGLAAALVLGLVAYFLFFTGADPVEEQVVTPKPQAAAPPAPAAEAPAVDESTDKPRRNQPGRNPFKALVVEPVAVPESVVAPVSGTAPAAGTTAPGTTAPVSTTSYTFKVTDVAPDNSTVTVKVNGEVYRNLTSGEVFAGVFKVRLISGQVNSFQFGEEIFNVNGDEAITLA